MELIFTTAYCLSSASQLKIFSLTVSLNEILVSNTGILVLETVSVLEALVLHKVLCHLIKKQWYSASNI